MLLVRSTPGILRPDVSSREQLMTMRTILQMDGILSGKSIETSGIIKTHLE